MIFDQKIKVFIQCILKIKVEVIDIKTTINIKEQKPQILADLNDSPAANTAKIGEEFS